MKLAGWAICGSLLINVAFGMVVAGSVHAAHPAPASPLVRCTRHAPDAVRRPVSGHYLAAMRMGWAVG